MKNSTNVSIRLIEKKEHAAGRRSNSIECCAVESAWATSYLACYLNDSA